MTEFTAADLSLENYWRAIILFGQNVASYKFALAKSLLELAQTGKTFISLEELAEPFSRHITEHLSISDKQTTSRSSRFLDACRQFNAGEITKEQLIDATVRLGFNNVVDAFHNVNKAEIPVRFFVDERQQVNKGITLHDNLLELLQHYQYHNLPHEVEARWRLVETAWQLNLARNTVVGYDNQDGLLFIPSNRRTTITSCRNALNGYQKGKCFYCFTNVSIEENSPDLADVDHFFPHVLSIYGIAHPIDGVWNLVLACQNCNRGAGGKFDRMPHRRFLERLHTRNEFLIESHHPLRETLMQQTGQSKSGRQSFLWNNYLDAATGPLINTNWEPELEHYPPAF
jgi:5-methylcytosine-specific restriction endonuclease McrA